MAAVGQSIEGASFTTGYTVNTTSTPEFPGPILRPGTVATGTEGSEWLFVKLAASQTIVAGDFLYVDSTDNTFTVKSLSNTAKALLGSLVGVAGATLSSSTTSYEYMWIQRAGYNASANCLSGSLANTALHTTATAGRIDDSAAGGTSAGVSGVVQLGTASASNLAAVMLNYPTIGAAD